MAPGLRWGGGCVTLRRQTCSLGDGYGAGQSPGGCRLGPPPKADALLPPWLLHGAAAGAQCMGGALGAQVLLSLTSAVAHLAHVDTVWLVREWEEAVTLTSPRGSPSSWGQ